jgi:outer membrane autotransporter protein
LANFVSVQYSHSALLNTNGNATSFGGHIDMGYRIPFQGNWFLEPLATIDAVHTEFRDVNLQGVSVDLNTNNDSVRGRLGARVGTTFVNGNYRIEPSITGGVWHSFSGDNIASISSGMYTLNLTDVDSHQTYGEIGGAVNVFDMASRWNAFIKGDFRFSSNDYTGGSVKGGVRFNW